MNKEEIVYEIKSIIIGEGEYVAPHKGTIKRLNKLLEGIKVKDGS